MRPRRKANTKQRETKKASLWGAVCLTHFFHFIRTKFFYDLTYLQQYGILQHYVTYLLQYDILQQYVTYLLQYDILQQYVTYLLRYDILQQYVTYLPHVGAVGAFRVLFFADLFCYQTT